jgi:hypothetical protein
MVDINPARTAKLAASMKKAFGELFDLVPLTSLGGDVNGRKVSDPGRSAILAITGQWDGPSDSKSPATRGAITDDVAHSWTASFPSVVFYEADLLWIPQRGDKLIRKVNNTAYEVVKPFPDDLGKIIIQLSNKARS